MYVMYINYKVVQYVGTYNERHRFKSLRKQKLLIGTTVAKLNSMIDTG